MQTQELERILKEQKQKLKVLSFKHEHAQTTGDRVLYRELIKQLKEHISDIIYLLSITPNKKIK